MAEAMEAEHADSISEPLLKSFRHFADEQNEDRLALAACSRAFSEPMTPDIVSRIRNETLVVAGARDDAGCDQTHGAPGPR